MSLSAGTIIADRFEVEALLGEGGMARVYRVRHLSLGSQHALKMVRTGSPALVRRLVREGQIQAQLRHPNVVAVSDLVEHGGELGLLMEYVDGASLEARVAQGAMAWAEAAPLFADILAGVAAAHAAGVLHRDLKPGNILLARQGEQLVPKVTDFGIARLLEPDGSGATRVGIAMGTPGYMAPEQMRNATGVDARADVFALGVVLYQLLTGDMPFSMSLELALLQIEEAEFEPLGRRVEGLPDAVTMAVAAALSADPDGRPPTCEAFAEALYADMPALLARVRQRAGTAGVVTAPVTSSRASLSTGTRPGGTPIGLLAGVSQSEAARPRDTWNAGGTIAPATSGEPRTPAAGPGATIAPAGAGEPVTPASATMGPGTIAPADPPRRRAWVPIGGGMAALIAVGLAIVVAVRPGAQAPPAASGGGRADAAPVETTAAMPAPPPPEAEPARAVAEPAPGSPPRSTDTRVAAAKAVPSSPEAPPPPPVTEAPVPAEPVVADAAPIADAPAAAAAAVEPTPPEAPAPTAPRVAGNWTGMANGRTFKMEIQKQDGGKLEASITLLLGPTERTSRYSGSIDPDGTLDLAEVGGTTRFQGKLAGGRLSGTFKMGNSKSLTWEAER